MIITILILGFLFGAILQYAALNRYNTISGMATLGDLTVAKAIAVAIGVGAILLNIAIGFGIASYHVKPLILGGIIIGGILFGAGMAVLGYCPGTMAVSLGEGSLDALLGIIGGLFGGVVYTLVLPVITKILGPDLGSLSINSIAGSGGLFYFLVMFIGLIFISIAFWLQKIDKTKNYRWLVAGMALAVLNVFVFSKYGSNRPIGASTSYPYLGDLLTGITQTDYFPKIEKPGRWELIFLSGAFLAGLIFSMAKRTFRLQLIHENWKKYKGNSKLKRSIWALVGGFILIFGARMAGGCTSGHVISGGMQLAISSLLFGVVVFGSLLITGKLFYKK